MASRLVNRNVVAGRGRTSMRLEPEFWEALHEICQREQIPMGEIVRWVEARSSPGGRTSAVRVFVLQYFRAAGNEQGHAEAGHGRREGLVEPDFSGANELPLLVRPEQGANQTR